MRQGSNCREGGEGGEEGFGERVMGEGTSGGVGCGFGERGEAVLSGERGRLWAGAQCSFRSVVVDSRGPPGVRVSATVFGGPKSTAGPRESVP